MIETIDGVQRLSLLGVVIQANQRSQQATQARYAAFCAGLYAMAEHQGLDRVPAELFGRARAMGGRA